MVLSSTTTLGGCERVLEANPQSYVGVGVELTMEAAGARVVRTLPEGAAAAAGLVEGDVLLEVDGQSLRGKHLAETVDLLRGEAGGHVTVLARTRTGDRHVDLVRRAISNR